MGTAQVWEGSVTSSLGTSPPSHVLSPTQLSHPRVGPSSPSLCPEPLTLGEHMALLSCPFRPLPQCHLPRTPSPSLPLHTVITPMRFQAEVILR